MRGIVQMPARAIHDLAGHVTTQAYGKRGQFICSVSRSLLNAVLLDACDKLPHVRCYFEANVRSLDASNQLVIEMRDKSVRQVTPRLVVGADGAYSAIRSNMLRYSRMDFSRCAAVRWRILRKFAVAGTDVERTQMRGIVCDAQRDSFLHGCCVCADNTSTTRTRSSPFRQRNNRGPRMRFSTPMRCTFGRGTSL